MPWLGLCPSNGQVLMVTLVLFVSGQPWSWGAGSGKGESWMPPQTELQICQRRGEEGGESLAEGWCEDSSEPWEEVWGREDTCGQGWSRAAVGGRGGGRGMQKDTLLLLCWISSTCGPAGVGSGQENEATPEATEGCWPLRPRPGDAYQPRFRQSKAMTPFSSGVHLMPGEGKSGFFAGSRGCSRASAWVLTPGTARTPRAVGQPL